RRAGADAHRGPALPEAVAGGRLKLAKKKTLRISDILRVFRQCPGEDSNLHARKGIGPQPTAYTNSATRAFRNRIITKAALLSTIAPLYATPFTYFLHPFLLPLLARFSYSPAPTQV